MAARLRMILAWSAFAAWVGWLGYKSLTHGRPVVVSRAQLLNSDVAVVAEVAVDGRNEPLRDVRVVEVLWPPASDAQFGPGPVPIVNWADCRDVNGAGQYVLLLKAHGPGAFRLAGIPRSPGSNARQHLAPVYPATPEVIAQFRAAAPAVKPAG